MRKPTLTHKYPLKYVLQWAIFIFVVILLLWAVLAQAAPAESSKDQEPTECPDGYFWRGGCVQVTGCPYGDSIPMDMCDKFAPEAQNPTSQNVAEVEKPVETVDKGCKP